MYIDMMWSTLHENDVYFDDFIIGISLSFGAFLQVLKTSIFDLWNEALENIWEVL